MLRPYRLAAPSRPPCALDRWTGSDWQLLEHHGVEVGAPPAVALDALARTRLGDLPVVTALFALRGLRFSEEMTLRDFFCAAPFVLLEEERESEMVFGVLIPAPAPNGARVRPASPEEFRGALPASPFAAIGTFRAGPAGRGARLWTETWARTSGAAPRLLFGAYWLAIGPWSAWIRRVILRAARARAEEAARAGGDR